MGTFNKHPDTSTAARVGEPTLVDPKPTSATEIMHEANRIAAGEAGEKNSASVETSGTGPISPSDPAPRSDTGSSVEVVPGNGVPPENSALPPSAADPNELKPTAAADPNELKPNVAENGQPLAPPQQVNEITPGTPGNSVQASTDPNDAPADDNEISSSKKKKKKGLHKIVPF